MRSPKTTHWLEAGAVGLGIGAAALLSAGTAHASEGTESAASATETKTRDSKPDQVKKSLSDANDEKPASQQSSNPADETGGAKSQETKTDPDPAKKSTQSKGSAKEADSPTERDTNVGTTGAKKAETTAKKSTAGTSRTTATLRDEDAPAAVSAPASKAATLVPVAAKTPTETPSVAAVETPTDPIAQWQKWIQRTFFNQTPTVSYAATETKKLANGTIQGTVRGSDADGDVLTYAVGPTKAGGSVSIDRTGVFTYAPPAGSSVATTDSFTVTVKDDAPENGWHIHGLLGFFVQGWQSSAATEIAVARRGSSTGGGTTGGGTTTGNGTTAAARYGWRSAKETAFTSASSLAAGWAVYNSPGHAGYGRRTPTAVSFADGAMTITGDAAGNTGGLAWTAGQQYGAWEVRMRVPTGAADYHPVALLWPDAENWPSGGEVDFFELINDSSRQRVGHYLHYSPQNRVVSGSTKVDATQWHNYAVSWTPQAINIYVDAQPVFTSTNPAQFPPGRMHLALQLDASEKRPINLGGGAKMSVAWARQYSLANIS